MSIYKDCDIRGIYEKEFDETTAYLIGRAIGSKMMGKNIAVGGDVRVSTPVLKCELIRGVLESGANVADLGMTPTPLFYFAIKRCSLDGGVTVTASHNPPQYNGFKLMLGKEPVASGDIADIRRRVEQEDFTQGAGLLTTQRADEAYIDSLIGRFGRGGIKVVVDCGNGTMSDVAPRAFEALGYEVIRLFCEFDGSFPNRPPNPAVYENLADLREAVIRHGAALGVAFDGDGDRVVFVDDAGNVVTSEQTLIIFMEHMARDPGFSIVYDQKSSSIVKKAVIAKGGKPLIERSGHAFIKKRFLDNDSLMAGEISGHFFFRELGYDDGLFAALMMASILTEKGEKLSDIAKGIAHLPITPDIRVRCPYSEQEGWLQKIREHAKQYETTEIDGVRVEFPDGWLLARKSVTEEGMTFRAEADNTEALNRIKDFVRRALPQIAQEIT